nr:immunoglobulin light chain junction region [Macaca mulatta]MOW30104.1 immunoglobulin light chain junction region [Macaca mulatta]
DYYCQVWDSYSVFF